jgi:hypothetical protein
VILKTKHTLHLEADEKKKISKAIKIEKSIIKEEKTHIPKNKPHRNFFKNAKEVGLKSLHNKLKRVMKEDKDL